LLIRKTAEIGGKSFSIEVGRMALLAQGAALVQLGETMALATACETTARPDIDFFPLTVDYREKAYAAGKIPGGFFKREGRPSTKEILSARLIDRPLRPMFPETYNNEVQILCNAFSYDGRNDPDVLSGNAASMAAMLSGIPLHGPLGWVRVGHLDGKLCLWPDDNRLKESKLDLVVAGTSEFVTMVEAGAQEVSETLILDAIDLAHDAIRAICRLQEEVMAEMGVAHAWKSYQAPADPNAGALDAVRSRFKEEIRRNYVQPTKAERKKVLSALSEEAVSLYGDAEESGAPGKWPVRAVKHAFQTVGDEVLRELILEGRRVDGRGPTDIRAIRCEVGVLPRAHGSALFTRGETQALVAATLGTSLDEQVIDGLQEEYKKKFLLHYNFPPSSVGEVRPMRGTSRRETGHGDLAERALEAVIPADDVFPYTLRLVSDILMSNGSSSMASVCGGTLAMLDAGVKVRAPVAGVAMGLVKEGSKVVILSDILGDEDHSGDMDFKVAGTEGGITSLQMDIKVKGVDRAVLERALHQARDGRFHVLREMAKALATPRADYSPYAPRLTQIRINPEKIGAVIGPGGKVIRQIQETTGATIEITDDGTVKIFAADGAAAEAARKQIEEITAVAEVGKIYEGPVIQMRDFGVFVQIMPQMDGMIHVSELADGYVEHPGDVVKIGDILRAKCIAVDDTGKVKLSRRAVLMEERGEVYEPTAPRGRGGDRGPRGGGRGGDRRGGDRGGDRGGERRGHGGGHGGHRGGGHGGGGHGGGGA